MKTPSAGLSGRAASAGVLRGGRVWTPRSLPGLLVEYDAIQESAADKAAMAQFTDRSGNGNHATQAVGASQPIYRTNYFGGRPALDLGYYAEQGQLVLNGPTLDLSATSGVTLFFVGTAAPGASGANPRMLFEHSVNYNNVTTSFALTRETDNAVQMTLKGNVGYASFKTTDTLTTRHKVISATLDKSASSNEVTVWINGVSAGTRPNNSNNTNSFGSAATYLGSRAGGLTLLQQGATGAFLLYNRVLSTAERQQVEAYLTTRWLQPPTNGLLICEGDSLTYELTYASNPYPEQLVALLANKPCYRNFGVNGQTLAQMTADAAVQVDPLLDSRVVNALLVWGGTNDMASPGSYQTAATTEGRLQAYCDARVAAGWTKANIGVFTMLPRSDAVGLPDAGKLATFESDRQLFNTWLRANYTTFAGFLVDVAADNRIGDAGDELNTTYYTSDKVHLNNTGLAIIAGLARTGLATVGIA